jgi:histidyl-tRNA synthetase
MKDLISSNLPGMRDLLPDEIARWQTAEECARQIFDQYGYVEIRTSILEPTELFARGIGSDTDIVGKEMYTFTDQNSRSVTLRPEATASVVRAYLQNSMYRSGDLTKLYYIGPMFRYEKRQKGRWRQFYQIGAEALGSDHPAIDAEMIEMAMWFLQSLGVQSRLQLNSVGCQKCRPAYMELLRSELKQYIPEMCEDCRRRSETNCLRVFDCKVDSCQPHINRLPSITEHLCPECQEHFAGVQAYLSEARIGYELVPRLVRGLDYYVRTAFEIVSGELGSQNALAGGGRYNGLSEVLGGPPVHALGFAMGLDRLVMVTPPERSSERQYKPELFLAYMGESAFRKAMEIARDLRHRGHRSYLDFSAGTLKSQMRLANRLGSKYVAILGENELESGRLPVKRLADSQQSEILIAEIAEFLKSR